MTGTAEIINANALDLPLADGSVDLVVTSPPYFGLRSYQDGGEHYEGQLGDEATPAEFVAGLLAATAEMSRVLKPEGSIWVNLGDKYANAQGAQGATGARATRTQAATYDRRGVTPGAPLKSLIGIPWRYALACIDDLGLILRAEVIWSKPNGLPESVTDRVRRSHETWFHFTKQPRYFSAVDEIREPAQAERPQAARAREIAERHGLTRAHKDALLSRGLGDTGRSAAVQTGTGKNTLEVQRLAEEASRVLGGYAREFTMTSQSLGKLPGSVWTIPTQPLVVPESLGIKHFAAFPMEWPRRIIRGWSPVGGVVLDPFGGTGTTATVAKALGRHGISVDLSADYCRLAQWRTNDPAELAKAAQAPKPQPVADGQMELSL